MLTAQVEVDGSKVGFGVAAREVGQEARGDQMADTAADRPLRVLSFSVPTPACERRTDVVGPDVRPVVVAEHADHQVATSRCRRTDSRSRAERVPSQPRPPASRSCRHGKSRGRSRVDVGDVLLLEQTVADAAAKRSSRSSWRPPRAQQPAEPPSWACRQQLPALRVPRSRPVRALISSCLNPQVSRRIRRLVTTR